MMFIDLVVVFELVELLIVLLDVIVFNLLLSGKIFGFYCKCNKFNVLFVSDFFVIQFYDIELSIEVFGV